MAQAPEGKRLIERLLGSEAKGELLALFHKNPGLVDSADGVSRRIGRSGKETEADLKDFLEMGILTGKVVGSMTLISLNREKDSEIQAALDSYFKEARP